LFVSILFDFVSLLGTALGFVHCKLTLLILHLHLSSLLPSPNKSHACHNYLLLLLHLPNYINSNDNKFFMSFQTNGGGYGDALYSDVNGMVIS
jgi:hypothetical protein